MSMKAYCETFGILSKWAIRRIKEHEWTAGLHPGYDTRDDRRTV